MKSEYNLSGAKLQLERERALAEYTDAKDFFIKNYLTKWQKYANAYLGEVKRNLNGNWHSNKSIGVVGAIVGTTLIRLKKGLLHGGNGFWGLKAYEETPETDLYQKCYDEILKYQYDSDHWAMEMHDDLLDALRFGGGFLRVDWVYDEKEREYFDEIKGVVKAVKEAEVIYDGNHLQRCDPFRTFPDPHAKSFFQDMRYIAEEEDISVEDLKDEKNSKKFNVEQEYKLMLAELNKKKYEKTQFIKQVTITKENQKKVLILDRFLVQFTPNPFRHGEINYTYFFYDRVPGKVIGQGLIEKIFDLTEFLQQLLNLMMDALVITTLPILVEKDTSLISSETLNWSPATVIRTPNGIDDIQRLDLGTTNPQSFNMTAEIQGLLNQIASNQDMLNSPAEGNPSGIKTYGQARLVVNEGNLKFADIIELNADLGISKLVKMLVENIQQFMVEKEARKLLGENAKSLNMGDKKIDMKMKFKYLSNADSSTDTNDQKINKIFNILPIFQQLPGGQQAINFDALANYIIDTLDLPEMIFKKLLPEQAQAAGDRNNQLLTKIMYLAKQTGRQPMEILQLLKDDPTGGKLNELLSQSAGAPAPEAQA